MTVSIGPRILSAGLLLSLSLAGQATTPEVRVSSGPYTPFHLRAETNQVQVRVVVRGHSGNAVPNLKQTDFKIFDQGEAKEIAGFSVETREAGSAAAPVPPAEVVKETQPVPAQTAAQPAAHWLGLYFDDIATSANELNSTKKAAAAFLAKIISPGDRVAIFTSSGGKIVDYTADKSALADAVTNKVQPHPRFSQSDSPVCPRITPYDAYRITILADEQLISAAKYELQKCEEQPVDAGDAYTIKTKPKQLDMDRNTILDQAEAVWGHARVVSQASLGSIEHAVADLSRLPGTKSLLLVSSGFLTGTLERERDMIINRALHSGVVINALDAKGLYADLIGRPFNEPAPPAGMRPEVFLMETMNAVDRREEPSSILSNFAASTGGMYFHHNNGFAEGFRELGSPETTYLIGFHPGDAAFDGKYHKLKVRLTASNSYSIQARPGYFAPAKPTGQSAEEVMDKQVLGSEIVKDFPGALDYHPGSKTSAGATPLHISLHVELKSLEFPQRDGRHLQKLTFVFALLDKDSAIVSAREGTMEFALGKARFESMMHSGVNATLTLDALPGTYKLRAVAMEAVHSKMATLSYAIKVP